MSDAPDPYRECHHGVARQPGFVGLVLYDDVYQDSRNGSRLRAEKTSGGNLDA